MLKKKEMVPPPCLDGLTIALWGRCNGKLVLGIFHFLREIVTILWKNSLSLFNSLSFAKIPLVKIVHVGKIQ